MVKHHSLRPFAVQILHPSFLVSSVSHILTEAVGTFAMCLNMKILSEKSGESQSWNWRRLFDKPDRPSRNSTKSAFRNSLSAWTF